MISSSARVLCVREHPVFEEPKHGLPIIGTGAGSATGPGVRLTICSSSRILWVREQPVLEEPKHGLPMIGSGSATGSGSGSGSRVTIFSSRVL
jgi:hypothetical protein